MDEVISCEIQPKSQTLEQEPLMLDWSNREAITESARCSRLQKNEHTLLTSSTKFDYSAA